MFRKRPELMTKKGLAKRAKLEARVNSTLLNSESSTTNDPSPVLLFSEAPALRTINYRHQKITIPETTNDFLIASELPNPLTSFYKIESGLRDCLSYWSLKNHLTQQSIDEILFIISLFFPNSQLPKCARTLNESVRKVETEAMGDGFIYQRSLREVLGLVLESTTEPIPDVVQFDIGSDGFSPDNSFFQLYPYFVIVVNIPYVKPFLWIAYGGKSKPSDPNIINKKLRSQYEDLIKTPINVGGREISFRLRKKRGDMPDQCQCAGTKNAGGYFACRKCHIEGVRLENPEKTVYPGISYPLRTKEEFVNAQASAAKIKPKKSLPENSKNHFIYQCDLA